MKLVFRFLLRVGLRFPIASSLFLSDAQCRPRGPGPELKMAKHGFLLRKLGMAFCGIGLGMMCFFVAALAATNVPIWFAWGYKFVAYGFCPVWPLARF
ncbi:hypothetical protein [Abditibacterium utsteinense]|nr:hypothetical protein [Abditibacterium utsteinense]